MNYPSIERGADRPEERLEIAFGRKDRYQTAGQTRRV